MPKLTSEKAIAGYFRGFLGHRFASTKIGAAGKSEALVGEIMKFIPREKIALVRFEKGVRKDQVMKKARRKFRRREGVLFVGVAPPPTTIFNFTTPKKFPICKNDAKGLV